MATATKTETPASTSKYLLWPITVECYEQMCAAGVIRNKRVFLWKGQLVEKMVKQRPHTVTLLRLSDAMKPLVAATAHVEQEASVKLLRRHDTYPEPDLKVLRGRPEDYPKIPTTASVPLLIEVAESSLGADRGEVLAVYAGEAIPVYWIANTVDRQIEVYTGPTGAGDDAGYSACAIYRPGQRVPVVLDGVEVGQIDVSVIFPDNDPWR